MTRTWSRLARVYDWQLPLERTALRVAADLATLEREERVLAGRWRHYGEGRDQLARQGTGRRRKAWHRRQQAVPLIHARRDAVRNGGATRAHVDHGPRQRVNQVIQIEELLDLTLAYHQHRPTLSVGANRLELEPRAAR